MHYKTTLPYSKVNFIWHSSHYDWHLKGICWYGHHICLFDTIIYNEYEPSETVACHIYSLTCREALSWLFRKKLFELCIGYHCTENSHKHFRLKSPKPLWAFIFDLYYKLHNPSYPLFGYYSKKYIFRKG